MRIINDDPTNNAITMQADLKRTYPASTTTTTAQWGSCCWISGIQPPISSYSLNIVIQVNSGNRDPVFNSPELVEVCNGQTNNYNFTFNLNPSDPDGDTFTVAYIPACTTSGCGDVSQRGLSISSSGIINWPNPGPNATYVVKVRATDARGATTYREFLLRVSTCNNKGCSQNVWW
jgi:hypothetical protein